VTLIAPAPSTPVPFETATSELAHFRWSPEVSVEPLPPPRAIAPYAYALEADLAEGSGRLILLFDPAGNPAWDGEFRLVTFAKAPIDGETVYDQWRAEVGWSWLIDALTGHEATFHAPSGTVTVVSNTHFGGLDAQPGHAEIELRASWTPDLDEGRGLAAHVAAWQDLLRMMAGLPPDTANVVTLVGRR
jgi:hypothetical protein